MTGCRHPQNERNFFLTLKEKKNITFTKILCFYIMKKDLYLVQHEKDPYLKEIENKTVLNF